MITMLMFFDPKLNQSDLDSNTRVEEGVEGGFGILQEVGKDHHDVETNDNDNGVGNDGQYC